MILLVLRLILSYMAIEFGNDDLFHDAIFFEKRNNFIEI